MIQFFEAEAFDATDGVGAFPFSNPTQIGDTDDGDWVRYDNVDFGDDPEALHQITAEVSSGSEGGVIEYRIDAPDGPLLATQRVFNTGGFNRFESVTTALGALSGVHDLYIVFRGTPTSIVDIDSFEITSGIAPPDPNIRFFEAEEFDATHGAGVFGIGDNRVIGSTEAGSWVRYDGVNFGDRTLATHELSMVLGSPNNGGAIEIRVGAPNGALLATQLVPNTGSFGNFTTVATDLGRLTGVQDLFLVFTGPGGSIADVNNFTITTTDPFPPILVQETVEGVEIIEHAPELELAEGTIQFTINAVDNAGRQGLISKDARGFGEGGHLTAWWQHGKVVLRVQTDEASTYLRSDKLALGTDHDVVIGFGLDGVRLFVNGQLVASDTTFTTGLSGNLEPLVLGASQWGSSSETADKIEDTFRGTLSNVAIYDTVLPSEAVATLSGLAPLTFEGPRDRTLRLDGAPVTVASLEDAVILDHSPELELDAGTLFIAFTPESTEGRQGVVSKDAFRLGEGGHLTVWYRDGDVEARLQSDSGQTILRSGPVSVGEEHEVAVTFGEQGFRLYVDGVLAAEDRDFTSGLQGNREPVVIGASQWGSSAETADELVDPFAGEISDVHFYDIALSPEIIADSAPLARDSLLEPGEIRSPAGSGAVYVEDFGAIADDGIDDTAAIRAALELATDNRSSQKLVVFGKGTYDVSDTVSPARPLREDGTRDGFIGRIDFQGAGQDLTEIRLADGLDFQGALVDFGNPGGSADAFHNNIRDLTINIGSGNAAATGLIYTSNNTGTVENVTVKSEDGGGLYGIDLLRIVNNGPHLIQDVTIEGFDYGLFLSGGESTHILESLTFIGQNEVGIFDNTSNFIWARDLDFQDTRQAYANKFNQN
ncbi:MAG: carbohydrate-binding protein, partial [Pseudomonadota bacterium]